MLWLKYWSWLCRLAFLWLGSLVFFFLFSIGWQTFAPPFQKQRPLLIVAAYVESDLILNKLRARIKVCFQLFLCSCLRFFFSFLCNHLVLCVGKSAFANLMWFARGLCNQSPWFREVSMLPFSLVLLVSLCFLTFWFLHWLLQFFYLLLCVVFVAIFCLFNILSHLIRMPIFIPLLFWVKFQSGIERVKIYWSWTFIFDVFSSSSGLVII